MHSTSSYMSKIFSGNTAYAAMQDAVSKGTVVLGASANHALGQFEVLAKSGPKGSAPYQVQMAAIISAASIKAQTWSDDAATPSPDRPAVGLGSSGDRKDTTQQRLVEAGGKPPPKSGGAGPHARPATNVSSRAALSEPVELQSAEYQVRNPGPTRAAVDTLSPPTTTVAGAPDPALEARGQGPGRLTPSPQRPEPATNRGPSRPIPGSSGPRAAGGLSATAIRTTMSQEEHAVLGKKGLADLAGQYSALALGVTERTIGKEHQVTWRQVREHSYIWTTKLPDGKAAVFRRLHSEDRRPAIKAMGIPPSQPRIANRYLATCDVAGLLNFKVVPETSVGRATLPDEDKPCLGLVIEQVEGPRAAKCPAARWRDPSVMREVTKLQLLDHLTGQGDRQPHNYIIGKNTDGSARVTGINNDICFGKNLRHPNDIAANGYHGTMMPSVVDTEMAAAILGLSEQTLRAKLSENLNKDEVDAAVARLSEMQAHIRELQTRQMIIKPDEWGRDDVRARFTTANSYVARDSGAATAVQVGPEVPAMQRSPIPTTATRLDPPPLMSSRALAPSLPAVPGPVAGRAGGPLLGGLENPV